MNYPDLGNYGLQVYSLLYTWLEMLVVFILYFWKLPKKKHFVLRLVAGIIIGLIPAVLFALLRSNVYNIWTRILLNFAIYGSFLVPVAFAFKGDPFALIIPWCLAVATREVSWHTISIIQTLLGVDSTKNMAFWNDSVPWRDILSKYALLFAISIAIYLIFGGHPLQETESPTLKRTIIISNFSILVLIIVSSLVREYQAQSAALEIAARTTCIALSFVIIALFQWISVQAQKDQEIVVLDQLLHDEKKHYESTRESVEELNRTTHDLKHRLATFQGRLTDEEISSLREAIKVYDSDSKTNNEVLDTVLYEQNTLCRKNGITLTCLANGPLLSFMEANHIYSLFNNALGNAIEALEKVKDPDKKIIDLSLRQEGNDVIIEISNYFVEAPKLVDGSLVSSKSDTSHHGYGTASMKFIVEQYHGTISFSTEKDIFFLKIKLPLPNKKA